MMAFTAHSHVFCPDLMYFHEKKVLRRQTKARKDEKGALERPDQNLLHFLEVEVQALIYTESSETLNCDLSPQISSRHPCRNRFPFSGEEVSHRTAW